jgi:hypothetical protein
MAGQACLAEKSPPHYRISNSLPVGNCSRGVRGALIQPAIERLLTGRAIVIPHGLQTVRDRDCRLIRSRALEGVIIRICRPNVAASIAVVRPAGTGVVGARREHVTPGQCPEQDDFDL